MNKILFVLPVVENEIDILKENIYYHLNLFSQYKLRYSIFIIVQSRSSLAVKQAADMFSDSHLFLEYTDVFSLSVSRNVGIDFFIKHQEYTHLSFIDVRVSWDAMMVQECIRLMNSQLMYWRGRIGWVDQEKVYIQHFKFGFLTKCFTGYVWDIVFSRECFIPFFNVNTCISNNLAQELQAGEDCIFSYCILGKLKNNELPVCKGTVYHPVRGSSVEKRKRYSKAQGALYRYLLPRLFTLSFGYGLYGLYFFILFAINTVFGLFAFSRDSRFIFVERVKGFFIYKYQKLIYEGSK